MSNTKFNEQIVDSIVACNKDGMSVSELISALQKVPNQNAKVCKDSCGCTYNIQLMLNGQDGKVHLL